MRIILVSESYPPVMSGVATVMHSYAKLFLSKGHSVAVITANNTYTSTASIIDGIKVYRIKGIKYYTRPDTTVPIPSTKELTRILKKERPDIIHIHTIATLAMTIKPIAKRLHIPIIATTHATPRWILTYVSYPPKLRTFLESLLWTMYLRTYLNSIAKVCTPSLYVKHELIRHGVNTPCEVVPMWIAKTPSVTRPTQLPNFQYDPSIRYYCFIGRLDIDKNVAFLIRAWIQFQKLPSRYKKQLLIIGTGTEMAKLKKLAETDQTQSIQFLGKYNEKELSFIYHHVQYFCMPALYETQSIVTLQAIAAGKTVLLAHSGALKELKQRFPKHVMVYSPRSQRDFIRCLKKTANTSKLPLVPIPVMDFYSKERIAKTILKLYTSTIHASS